MNEKEKTPLIQVENLKKYYPIKGGIITHTTGLIKAVDGVSFSIMEGETLGLVGESGCGKSTIGRQLVGLESPREGSCTRERISPKWENGSLQGSGPSCRWYFRIPILL